MLVGRTGLSPVMVGRTAELARLQGLVGASPRPAVALVAGEPGIGKTRLVQELVGTVRPGTVVLAGQADPGTVGRPMELFLDAVRHARCEPDDERLIVVRDATRSIEERVRAAVELVELLTEGTAGLVVFEDLHWADAESLVVFEQLADPEHGSLVLVGTYRPEGLSRRHPAGELLPRLERRHGVSHVHLGRLSPAEVSTFLAAVFDEDPSYRAVEALHTRTGGNPFFLEELVASARDLPHRDLGAVPLPWTVAELVNAQLEDLDGDVRDLVATASVLGRRVSFDLLAAVTGTGEDELIDRLRVAVDSGLLVETDPDVFSFHHDIAREAIESGLLGRQRRRLHEAALDALHRAGSHDHVAIAHHAQGAGRYDEMVAAARHGARESLAVGSSYQALQLAEMGLSEVEADLELRSLATQAAWLADLLDEALDHADAWLRIARAAGDISHEAAALCQRLRIAYDIGDMPGLATYTDALIDTVDQLTDDEERARAMGFIAQSYMLRDQVEPTRQWADKALALADLHGFDAVRRAAMLEKGTALIIVPATVAEGRELLETAAAEAERAGDHVLAARALVNLAWQARQSSRLDEARALVQRMRRQAEAGGFDSMASHARVEAMALLAVADSDLDAALEVLDQGARDGPARAVSRNRRWLAVLRAGLALEAGDLAAAACHAGDAKPATPRTVVGVLGLDVHIAARQGDLAAARSSLAALVEATDAEGYAVAAQVHDLVAAGLGAGLGTAELRPLVERVGLYAGHRLDADHPWRQLLDAQLTEADGDLEAAATSYAAVADSADQATGVLGRHRGTAHVGAARCLIALGDLDGARAHAVAAAADLDRWRGWRVAELHAVQRRLGLEAGPTGTDALTPREREVAALLVEGLSNAALAERLYISPRTAAVHVSNILTKLAMSSRSEIAAWALREGLVEQPS